MKKDNTMRARPTRPAIDIKDNIRATIPLSTLFVILFCFTSCVSTYTALQEIEPGINKQQVRNTIGRPDSVSRWDGMDRWTYKLKWNAQEYTQDVFFDEGRVQKTGPLTPYPNYRKKMIEAESLEEYEINAILYQKQKEAGFREINSVNTSNKLLRFCSNRFDDKEVLNCRNIMSGNKFSYPDLRFCDNKINHSQAEQLKCLKIISNKTFHESALEFCGNKINHSRIRKLKCLKIISNKQFSHPALKFCEKNTGSAGTRLKCLNNLGNKAI